MRGPSLSLPEEVARISKQVWAAALLIAAPLWFNTTFAVLGKRFDYPDILRRPTPEILERFREGGPSLILLWWGFMLSGFLMIGAVVLLSQALGFGGVLPLATTIGVLAGLVQVLGLLRWVYLVPRLARDHADPHASPARREATAAIFRAFHQYLGVGVGEHLGYLLTGLWSILVGIAIVLGEVLAAWLGWPGIVIGAGLAVSSAEFLGPNEERGWAMAGAAIPILYIAWSIWLLGLGVALIV
jgi:Domain of unknown function (DUF4386)